MQKAACEREVDLRVEIQKLLSEDSLHSRVQKAIETVQKHKPEDLNKDQLLSALQEGGIIDELLSCISTDEEKELIKEDLIPQLPKDSRNSHNHVHGTKVENKGLSLYVHCGQGRAFVDNFLLQESSHRETTATLKLYVQFLGKLFSSKCIPAVCEPIFSETFEFQLLDVEDFRASSDPLNLLGFDDSIHLVLLRLNWDGEISLISSYYLKWKGVLSCTDSKMKQLVELHGVGMEHTVPVGLLSIELSTSPQFQTFFSHELISTHMEMEKIRWVENNHVFITYARDWWQEYLDIRPQHYQRVVRIFAEDENAISKPVVSWVHRFDAYPLIDTPREAAWFVSLLRCSRSIPTIGSKHTVSENWCNPSTFLVTKKSGVESHALLLCSFFLGFGLRAFVCLGTLKNDSSYAWVMTLDRHQNVTFWDPVSSIRYLHQVTGEIQPITSSKQHSFKSIGCVFDDKSYFANCQATDEVEECTFDLQNSSHWKAMSYDALKLIPKEAIPVLLPPRLDCVSLSSTIRHEIRDLLKEHRNVLGLTTKWDSKLSNLMYMALSTYELQGKTGAFIDVEEFLSAVDNSTPEGHTFKALPLHFCHTQTQKAFNDFLRSAFGNSIIECRGDEIRFGVQARIYEYAEDVISLWIMIAVRYKHITQ